MHATWHEASKIPTGFVRSSQIRKSNNNKAPKQSWIKIHDLQQFVASMFAGCSMPPLDQFLQLEIQQDQCCIKLQKYTQSFISSEHENKYIYYLDSGKIFLKKKNSSQLDHEYESARSINRVLSANSFHSSKHKPKQGKQKQKKSIQVKQNSFFMLANYKKVSDVQNYCISGYENGEYNQCLVGKIKINQNYNTDWYIAQTFKHDFISSLFQDEQRNVSEHKLKGLSRFFKCDTFRRGTFLVVQQQANQRLFIIKSGQCQYSKSFSYKQKNHQNTKILKIANGESGAVIGAQFLLYDFLGSSKPATVATRAMAELENQRQKLIFKMQNRGVNNFTISILSAHAQIYYISVSKFKQLCEKYVPEVPQNLRKNIEGNYITLLRTTKEKLELELIKIQRNQNKANDQRVLIQAKLRTGHFDTNDPIDPQSPQIQQKSPIRIKKSQFLQNNLQQKQIQKQRNKRLQKKIELILQSNKANIDYKKKIQIILRDKLTQSRLANQTPILEKNTPKQSSPQNIANQNGKANDESPTAIQKSQTKKDLQQIFMNQQDKYRSSSIERQNQIISRKEMILRRRYNSVNNVLIVHKECYDRDKNKLFRMDLIRRGIADENSRKSSLQDKNRISMQALSTKIKKQCMEKINKANKIKQQFMTIRSQCQHCHCYDDIDSTNGGTHKDIKSQMMKTGLAWRPSQFQNDNYQQPLEKLHSRTKLISEKAARKYRHNIHLHQKKRRFPSSSVKRLSSPSLF